VPPVFALYIVLKIFLYTIAALLFVIFLIMFAPINYRAYYSRSKKTGCRVRVSWLFGFLRYKLISEDGKTVSKLYILFYNALWRSAKKKKKTLKPKTKKRKEREGFSIDKILKKIFKGSPKPENAADVLLRIKDAYEYPDREAVVSLTAGLIKKILLAVKPKYIDIEGEFGFDDPSETGIVLGIYEAAAGIAGLRREVRLNGNFNEKIFLINAKVKGKMILAKIIVPLIKYLMQKPVSKIIFAH